MKKILVVDNDKFILEFMNDVLSERGHKVVTAEGGLSAVDILKTYTPDIIFVDLVMPNIEGKQLCKIIRSMPELRDVCIVILSAIAAEEDLKIKEFKADACIAKGPVNDMAKHVLAIVDRLGLTPTKGLPGETIGVEGIFPRNITKELLSIKNHFEIILGKISEGVLEVTSEGRIVYTNSIAVSIIGIPEEKLLGSHFIDLFSADDRHRVAELVESSGDKPQKTIGEFFFGLNGRKVTLQFLPIVEYSATSLVIINDITGRLQAEQELQEERNKLKSMVGAIEDGLSIQDLDYNISYQNDVLKDLFGDRVGEKCYLVYEGKDMVCDGCPVKMAYKDGSSHTSERSAIMPSGGITFWENTSNPIRDAGGKIISCLEIARNITDRKQAEEEKRRLESHLQQSQKLESIGTLAGGIAHDFNNILSSIIGYTELALDDAEKGTLLEENLQAVYSAGERARDLVKQILAFARQSNEAKKPTRVDNIAEEALKLIRSAIPTTIEIRKKIESNSLVTGNATQVHQLFMNLCTNAAHAMEDSGGILEVGLVDVEVDAGSPLMQSGLKPGDYIKISVSDTGSGIDQDIIDSIFEPYFTTRGVGEGTGMGLALVYGIVESYSGKITVNSELGKGTTFCIFLPSTKKRGVYQPDKQGELPSGNERILLIDDELPIAKMGSQILERLGYHVTVRTSSVEALELFRSKPNDFDLVITDMTMPNLTGDKLAVELMKMRSDIPVILCTGYSKKISDKTASEIGIKGFAYKPVVKVDLAKIVRKVLDETKSPTHK